MALESFHPTIRNHGRTLNDSGLVLSWLVTLASCLLTLTASALAQQQTPSRQTESLYRQGLAALQSGDLVKARAAFEQVVKLAPGSAEAHNLLGWALFAQGQTAESISQFRTALRLKPDLAEAHMNLANALAKKGASCVPAAPISQARWDAMQKMEELGKQQQKVVPPCQIRNKVCVPVNLLLGMWAAFPKLSHSSTSETWDC